MNAQSEAAAQAALARGMVKLVEAAHDKMPAERIVGVLLGSALELARTGGVDVDTARDTCINILRIVAARIKGAQS